MTESTVHISLGSTGLPPREFRLFTAGKVDTLKGVFTFNDVAAREVMAAYQEHGNELPMDYDHAMADPFSAPKDRVAAGWFNPEVRRGELWATNVRWTPRATKEICDREWRYISPTFLATDDPSRRIKRLINCALTNLPATRNLTPIAASMGSQTVTCELTDADRNVARCLGLTDAQALANKRAELTRAPNIVGLTDAEKRIAHSLGLTEAQALYNKHLAETARNR
jgi:phage I-like protein